jgi:hypothetical protein
MPSGLVAFALADVADLVHGVEAIVVSVEPLAQVEAMIQDEAAHDRRGRETPGFE